MLVWFSLRLQGSPLLCLVVTPTDALREGVLRGGYPYVRIGGESLAEPYLMEPCFGPDGGIAKVGHDVPCGCAVSVGVVRGWTMADGVAN